MNNLVSFSFNESLYHKEDYKTRMVGTSDCNMFIPFYSLFAHDMLSFEKVDVSVLEYTLPSIPRPGRYSRQYSRMIEHLIGTGVPYQHKYTLAGVNHTINMHRGLLYRDDVVLMCLGVDTEYIMSTPIDEVTQNPDVTKFSLFINNIFDEDVALKNVKKKVEAGYINPLKEVGIDVIMTSRINSWLFKNNFEIPKFRDLGGLLKHLQEDMPKVLLIE